MAIYHFQAKIIGRSQGRSAVAAAAYRSASELDDQRQGQSFDYTDKPHVVHSEILLPAEAPAWMADRSQLWNAVELGEKCKDSQVAREVEFAIPQELSQAEGIESRMAERAQELADSKSHGVGEGNCDAGRTAIVI
jgi:hypothetical protein